ncbi:MAG: YafY family transcriptional regulator [Lachnospiraceae bacterium]|nr:YafY family transcriptional regulator [Lachnospiraceae bacterium]
MQESRLFRILYYLLDKGRATAPELAEKFEVSVRTIYRDVDAISSAGIPIYVTTGRNGGIQFLDDYVLNKSFFSESEKLEILSSLQSLSAVQYPEVDTILNKLGAIFQTSLTDWIDVDFSRWGSAAESENRLFRQLKQAIFENREITFDYYASSGDSCKRNVYPYKLVYKDKAWYLYALCLSRNENRLFRLSRIKNINLTEIRFECKTDTYQYHSVFPMPEEIGNLIDLELEFTLDVGYRLFDTLDDTAITKHENGYTVKLTLPENDWLYDFLMSFGSKVTIIRPNSIRQTLKTKHEEARDHHKGE